MPVQIHGIPSVREVSDADSMLCTNRYISAGYTIILDVEHQFQATTGPFWRDGRHPTANTCHHAIRT